MRVVALLLGVFFLENVTKITPNGRRPSPDFVHGDFEQRLNSGRIRQEEQTPQSSAPVSEGQLVDPYGLKQGEMMGLWGSAMVANACSSAVGGGWGFILRAGWGILGIGVHPILKWLRLRNSELYYRN